MKPIEIIKKTVLTLLALFLVLLLALFTMDLGFLRNTVEQQVRDATGRSFEIEGNFSLHLGRELVVYASEISLGNAEWAGSKPLARLDSLELVIDTRSLWSGPVVIKEARFEGLNVDLQQNANGQSNWEMNTGTPRSSPDHQLPFLVETVLLTGAEIRFQSVRLDQPVVAVIHQLEEHVDADGYINTHITGSLNEKVMEFSGIAGPYSRLLSGEDFSLEGDGSFGTISVAGTFAFDNIWKPVRPVFDISIEGPELSELTAMLGIKGMGAGGLSFSAIGKVENETLVTVITGNFGELDLDIRATASSLQDLSGATYHAMINGPNFGRLARLAGYDAWPESEFLIDAHLQRPGEGLQIERLELSVADAKLVLSGIVPAFPEPGGAELSLNITGEDLSHFHGAAGLNSLPTGYFALNGDLTAHGDGTTRVNFQYELPLGTGSLSGILGSGKNLAGSDLLFNGKGGDANQLGDILGVSGLASEPWIAMASIKVNDPGFYQFENTFFKTLDLSVELSGKVGSETVKRETDVHFSIGGKRLSDFQAMAGAGVSLPGQPFSFSGQATAVPGAWKLTEVTGNTGSTHFVINGRLGQEQSLAGSNLSIVASGEDLGKMFSLPGEANLPDGPFTLRSSIALSTDRLEITDFHTAAGPFKLSFTADLPWPINPGEGTFSFQSSGQNITRILPELAGLAFDAEDFSVVASGNWNQGQIFIGESSARIGDSSISAKGTLALPPNLSSTNLTLEINSPDLSSLGTVDGERWGRVPFSLNTTFKGTTQKFTMEQFRSRLGNSDIQGSFAVDFEPEIPRFDLRFSTDLLNLKPFQAVTVDEQPENLGDSEDRLIPELVFPMDALSRFEGRFAFLADVVLMENMTLHNNAMTGVVKNGGLTITELGTDGYTGRLVVSASLQPAPGGSANLSFSARSKDLVINLFRQSEEDKKLLPAFDIAIELAGTGASLRAVAAALSGNIRMNSEGGIVKNRKAESVSGLFLAQVVAAISPSESGKEEINISCFAAVIGVNEGVMSLDPGIAIQSDKLNVYATGEIDLETEKLNVNFRTETRSAAKLSASELISPYVKLSGTLANPSVALDPKGTLLSGGAAYLTGGLSILAMKALASLTTSKDPCGEHLAAAKK